MKEKQIYIVLYEKTVKADNYEKAKKKGIRETPEGMIFYAVL